MPLADYIRELTAGDAFLEGDPTTVYWIKDRSTVMFRKYPLRGADTSSFRFYLGCFAKDVRHCYCTSSRLTGANPSTFQALNYTYFKDEAHVWTIGGKLKDADAATFSVCDDGILAEADVVATVPKPLLAFGYAKDKHRVYYYGLDARNGSVRKADPASFVSLGDGHFGKDDQAVFCGFAPLPRADVASWGKLGGLYSKDIRHVYYTGKLLRGADPSSFLVVDAPHQQLARDGHRFFSFGNEIDAQKFETICAERKRPPQPRICITCSGSGQCYCIRKGQGISEGCPRCGGSGKCHACGGTGKA